MYFVYIAVLVVCSILHHHHHLVASLSTSCQSRHHTTYCNQYKQIDLNSDDLASSLPILIELNTRFLANLHSFHFEITSIHTDRHVDQLAGNAIDESLFQFSIHNDSRSSSSVELKIDSSQMYLFVNKTVKLRLYGDASDQTEWGNCSIVLDFVQLSSSSSSQPESNVVSVYYETQQNETLTSNEILIDMSSLMPDLICQRGAQYSISTITRSPNSLISPSLKLDSDDYLTISFAPFTSDKIYQDVYLLVEEVLDPHKTYLFLVRVYSSKQAGANLLYRSKRFAKKNVVQPSTVDTTVDSDEYDEETELPAPQIVNKQIGNSGSGMSSPGNSLHHHTSNFNMLKTAQLAITEETIGLQTKLKIYDYVWMDYQLNASDYVKQRIQLIAPDNPILNITQPFDFEIGGPLHTFQIIFTRKIDKRTIKDIKPITIKVIDVNDEPPVWRMDEPVPYTAVVERDPRPGQLVFQFLADDPDSGSEIVYTLHSKSPNTTRLIMKDGKLFTAPGAPFAHETYKILVSAYDAKAANAKSSSHHNPHYGQYQPSSVYDQLSNKSQEIFAELTVIVGKRAPQFYQSEYRVNISEDSQIGSAVVQMRAKSFNPDPYNKKHLRYSLQTRQGQSAEFSIYSENGTVILARKVDYETDVREYNLVVHVTEQSGWLLSSSARLTVCIEDSNDNAPQFTLSEYVRNQPVPEDLNADTFIISVEVQDRDSDRNGEIDWHVSNANFYIRPYSSSDTTRAKIYNVGRLDFEIPQHMYRFDVVACDRGLPQPLCASAKVSVPVSNVNDEKPKFDQKVILATLDENVPSGAYVTTVQATDGDGDRIFFKLKDESGPFEINRESGIVKVKFDRRIDPNEDYYNLTVYAEDDGSCCCPPPPNQAGNRVYLKYSYYSTAASAANCKPKINREEATLVIKIRDINDHAPKFLNCDAYSRQAQVEEERPIGTPIIRVEALDKDKGENGEIEYEILSTHYSSSHDRNAPFRIDSSTGLISTNIIFDRESNGKFNEHSVTVKAKDKGKPHPLSDVCSFRIKVLDINDHAPQFYEPEYKLPIKYGTQPGQNIQRIIASDADSGKNAEIRYRVEQAGEFAKYFSVDEMTGMIALKREIPQRLINKNRPIMFNLIAEDGGMPTPKSSVVTVSVTFADRDNEPPKWLAETEKRFERVVRIPEAISLNQVVETLEAESNYAPNSKLIFDFSPKPQPESFIIQQEKIVGGLGNRFRGRIIVYQPLDAEAQNYYELHVRVQNAAAQPMEITGVVKVEILDSNDNIPLFTQPTYLANVSENALPGAYVTKVTAEDKDISAPNNVVVYNINDQDHSRKFQIDPYTGNITTRVVLDREEIKVYFIDVTACDSAMSDRPNMNTPNCRTANVRIDVSDTNDNSPYFNATLYEATVHENAERGTPIITVQANDADEEAQQPLRYLITDGNEDNVFGVRETIGEIYVLNSGKLDYETLDQYYLTLTVSDGLHNASTNVKINLIDVNDNPPIFTEQPPYEIELVEEDLNFPRIILKINATDGDIKRPNTIIFKINYNYTHNGSNSFRPFNINPHTGEIILQEKLDRDYPHGRPVWSFNVIASDEGGMKGSMDSTAVVNVRLIDINDNAPVFDRPPYIGHVMENSKPGTLIMTVTANDYDDPHMGQNAQLRYQIAENKKFGNLDVFSINDTTGQIYQNLKLDREQIDKYTIEVCATDGSGKRGCGQVTIYVDDANDQAPVFQSNTYTETIDENWPIGERVLVVTATDKDIGPNAELSYGLKSECLVRNTVYTGNDEQDCLDGVREPKYFKVDTEREANSGFVKLAKQVNFDPPDYHRLFKLNVSVSDGVHRNYTTVFVNIADVNDEAPRFKEPVKNVPVYESIPPLTIITNFSAEDLDTLEANRRFSYSLDRMSDGAHEFSIDQNGNLYNLEPLDRELRDKYILRIFAIDEGYPPQTGIATLNLEILDVNDNFPIFAEQYRPVVMENTPPGQFVLKVRAKDLDSPDNGPPFRFELPDKLSVWPSPKTPKFNLTYVPDELNGDNHARVYSLATFDRESGECGLTPRATPSSFTYEYEKAQLCKEYKIPVVIKDNGKPPQQGVNYLTVTIGDINDNLHYPGTKRIMVFDYKGSVSRRSTLIGTVYAEDKDDWDASDKEFKFAPETDDTIRQMFELVESINDLRYSDAQYSPGSIIVKPGIRQGVYEFRVLVRDLTRPEYQPQESTVMITVKQINDELVTNSGSIRLSGATAERLIETRYSPNERSLLVEIQTYLARQVYKLESIENLKFFSIQNHKTQPNTVDIRFSAHGSPALRTERLNGLLAHNRTSFQQWLVSLDPNLELVAVGIDECAESERKCKEGGCRSVTFYDSHQASVVNANQTGFVGVHATERAECSCKSLQGFSMQQLQNRTCSDYNYCLNGGMCVKQGFIQKCQCPKGYDGPRCQKTVRHFNNSGGFTWLPALPQCQDLVMSFEFVTTNSKGLLFYNGPIVNEDVSPTAQSSIKYQQDFIAVQLDKSRLVFQIKQGVNGRTHTYTLSNNQKPLNDGFWHRVDIYKKDFKYRITIDRCTDNDNTNTLVDNESAKYAARVGHKSGYGSNDHPSVSINGCEAEFQVQIHDLYINTNQYYPLQLGGVYDRTQVARTLDYKGNFVGCIRNLRVNGELYDMQVESSQSTGFQENSVDACPRADKLCNPNNDTSYCLNGVCEANFYKSECVCKPGYRGANCEFKSLPFDFQTPNINKRAGSYLKYRYVWQSDTKNSAYDAYLKKFTKIQLLFRTRENTSDRAQTLFQITSPNRAQYVYLEIANNRLQFRYDIGAGESSIQITHVPVSDGRWHLARAERYGKEASVMLDDGEGLKMNYTFGLPSTSSSSSSSSSTSLSNQNSPNSNSLIIGKEMDVDRDSIFLGAKVVQIKVSGYEISRDYHDSCMMDVRFDDKPLPYTQQEERAFEDYAIKMETVNVKDGCASVDYCKGIFCPHNQICLDQWRLGECQCPHGQQLNGTKCQDVNDCQLCLAEGTKHCEKYRDNRIVAYENFEQNYYQENNGGSAVMSNANNPIGDYPPDSWYLSNELSSDFTQTHNVWTIEADDHVQISGFKCVCRKGYFGQYCNAQASRRAAVFMSFEAMVIIVICLIILSILIITVSVYSRVKRQTPKHYMLGVDPNDEVRETIINYVEEGCPDVDQSAYDITQLAKPIDPNGFPPPMQHPHHLHHHPMFPVVHEMDGGITAVDGEFQPAVPKQKPPLQDISYIRRDVPPVTHISGVTGGKMLRPQNADVGDFINSKLREIDNDPVQPPYDSLQEYAYEGEGSMYGSTLSSLNEQNEEHEDLNESHHAEKPSSQRKSDKDPAAASKLVTFKKDAKQQSSSNTNLDSDLEQIKNWGPKFNKISNIYGINTADSPTPPDNTS